MSDSQSDEDNVRKSTDGGRVSLSELRSAVTAEEAQAYGMAILIKEADKDGN